jgi:hypothetical protein
MGDYFRLVRRNSTSLHEVLRLKDDKCELSKTGCLTAYHSSFEVKTEHHARNS